MRILHFDAYAKTFREGEYIEKFVLGLEVGEMEATNVEASDITIVSRSVGSREVRFDPESGKNVVDQTPGGESRVVGVKELVKKEEEWTIVCDRIRTKEEFVIRFRDEELTKSDLRHLYNEECDRFTEHSYQGYGVKFRYRLYTPKTGGGKKYPLVFTLHGSGESGDESHYDNRTQIASSRLALSFAMEEWQEKHPCYIVAPQFPSVELSYETDAYHDAFRDLIRSVGQKGHIDETRIYCAALSMGARIIYAMIRRYPDEFAGLILNSGNPDGVKLECVKRLPITIGHIERDDVVMTQFGKDAFRDAVIGGNYEAKMDLYAYEDVERCHLRNAHQSWAVVLDDIGNLEWLFAQRKGREAEKKGIPIIKTFKAELEGIIEDGWVCVSLKRLAELHGWTLETEEETINVKGSDRTVRIHKVDGTAECPDKKEISKSPIKMKLRGLDLFVGYDFIAGFMGLHTTVYFR